MGLEIEGRLGEDVAVFLTITSTASEASDLGYLLHKHPDRVQSFDMPVGKAHVFYPGGFDRSVHSRLASRGRSGRPGTG